MKFLEAVQALREKGFKAAALNGGDSSVDNLSINNPSINNPSISEVFSDSRKVTPGSVFCCVKGEKSDGHQYIAEVKNAGAAALVCERSVETDLPVMLTDSARAVMGELASLIYERPSSKMLMIGVTGTNGKTTTTYALRSILRAAGIKSGLLGTIVESDGDRETDAERTTPESCDIQRRLAAMVKNGCGACVMETSSHGLQIGRLDGCLFDAAIFTNLNPEHLDFHKDMESYFQAKRLLFTKYLKKNGLAVFNADDRYGARLLEEYSYAYAHASGAGAGLPEIKKFSVSDAADLKMDKNGTEFKISDGISNGGKPVEFTSPLVGGFNVSNVMAAVTALSGRFGGDVLARGVAAIPQVPGRLEKHRLPNGACCFIDFAHTPEALRNVLSVAREFCPGRLISVFGHGGGRYASNRPALGKTAAGLADMIVVTMDNPRDEDPALIAESIVRGIEEGNKKSGRDVRHKIILDRKEAIAAALSVAGPEDVLVVSGKGPEKFLTIKDRKIPYNDAETVEEWIRLARP